jgi:subtilase family serine protease
VRFCLLPTLLLALLLASLLCAQPRSDQGPVDPSFPIRPVTLLLKPSPPQQQALAQLLAAQQNRSSPDYHGWLSPEEYADRFGASRERIGEIQGWLEAQGFHITYTARGRNWLAFDATAGQLAQAFHTEIHRYLADGATHFANANAPTIPAALADVAAGLRGLDDFHPKPPALKVTPNFTTLGVHYLAPGDIATIYDLNPIYTAGIDGTGQRLVVAGQTDIYSSDPAAFRSIFKLSSNPPQLVLYGPDPGFPSTGDLDEADLDLEWSGAIAPNAAILYVYSMDVFSSVEYAIDQNLAPVISMSYGGCELQNEGLLSSEQTLAQQANAEGITWVAAAGDTGAAGCDAQGSAEATQGLAVEFPASIPEVTAVGGTEFKEGAGTYWSTSNGANQASALSYIPETAWNDTVINGGLMAGGGGASTYYGTPAWQTGPGFPNDGHRDLPDIALSASADHDGYIVCTQGSCAGSTLAQGYSVFGGTSAPTPVFAGMLALLNHYLAATGNATQPGLGNINPTLYALAQSSPAAFHDITTGNNMVPCQVGTPDCSTGSFGYSAAPGYDPVTGLGSVDAYNLFTAWAPAPSAIQVSATWNGSSWSGPLSFQLRAGRARKAAPACRLTS